MKSSHTLPVPTTTRELQNRLDWLSKKAMEEKNDKTIPWKLKGFKGLLEVIESEPVIIRAMEKLRKNPGSMTPGVDEKTIRNFLQMNYDKVIEYVKSNLRNYHPVDVRRQWIPKPGKKEKRPLGIPAIGDRIIQECVRIVIEPILDPQFYEHSYGFRPMRDTKNALQRANDVMWTTGNFWVVEGDISKFFDRVNHTVLLKKLFALGIRDKRVLMIIKSMLHAGIMGECSRNDLGTPQGGIISPVLANVYLHSLDKWIEREWENKKITPKNKKNGKKRKEYTENSYNKERRESNLKPAYFIRYADDWILITDSKKNAEKWKWKISKFLKDELKVELSQEKTVITNASRKAVKFLGYELKLRKNGKKKPESNGSAQHKYVIQSKPDGDRLKAKIENLREEIRKIPKQRNKTKMLEQVNKANSIIIGLQNYYDICTHVNSTFGKYAHSVQFTALRAISKLRKVNHRFGKYTLIKANETDNLTRKHENYKSKIPYVKIDNMKIGITNLSFVKTTCGRKKDENSNVSYYIKDQRETPFTALGRQLYAKRTGKKEMAERLDELMDLDLSWMHKNKDPKYNMEYVISRARVFNQDKGACRCCKKVVGKDISYFECHHVRPLLPMHEVNKTGNLATLCRDCHNAIHSNQARESYPQYDAKTWNKIVAYRKRLTEKVIVKSIKSKKKKVKSAA